jgi:hypothetical protein
MVTGECALALAGEQMSLTVVTRSGWPAIAYV